MIGLKIREYDDVREEHYNTYECDWTRETCNYDELYWYGRDEVSIQSLKDFFYKEGIKRGNDQYYDPEMEMYIDEGDLDKHINTYYCRVY